MRQSQMTLHLVPAPGTMERSLLVDVLVRMTRAWLDLQQREREEAAQASEITEAQAQEGQEVMQ